MAKRAKSAKRRPSPGKGKFTFPPTISRADLLKNGDDDWLRDFIYRLVQSLNRLIVCREAFGRELGLTGSQFAVLMGVANRQGEEGITIAALTAYIGLAGTHVTTEVGRLIRKGLLTKRPNLQDRRSVLVSLSPKGENAVAQVSTIVRSINDILFQSIGSKQIDAVNQFAATLLRNSEYALAEIRIRGGRRSRAAV